MSLHLFTIAEKLEMANDTGDLNSFLSQRCPFDADRNIN